MIKIWELNVFTIHFQSIVLSKHYPKRLAKDLYAGNRPSATASLKDSRNSLSGTVHWDCLWWISSNNMLKVLNLSFTADLEIPVLLLTTSPVNEEFPAGEAPWTESVCRICSKDKYRKTRKNVPWTILKKNVDSHECKTSKP